MCNSMCLLSKSVLDYWSNGPPPHEVRGHCVCLQLPSSPRPVSSASLFWLISPSALDISGAMLVKNCCHDHGGMCVITGSMSHLRRGA